MRKVTAVFGALDHVKRTVDQPPELLDQSTKIFSSMIIQGFVIF